MTCQLSQRQKDIILYLAMVSDVTTTKQLAEMFSISVRSIKYDLADVRSWLAEKDIQLFSKRGSGIWLELTSEQKKALKSSVLSDEMDSYVSNQHIRYHKIIFELINENGTLTSDRLSERIKVSKNTIISDLDRAERLLNEYGLLLVRQPSKGFAVQGQELPKRQILEQMIQEELTEYDVYYIINKLLQAHDYEKDIQIGVNKQFQTIYSQVLATMSEVLATIDPAELNYSEVLSLTIRTSISIMRLQNKCTIGDYRQLNESSLKNEVPYQLINSAYTYFDLPIFADEYDYINSDMLHDVPQYDILTITKKIIRQVSEDTGYHFSEDSLLFNNLFVHLSIRLSKKHSYLNEYNPFADDVKEKYPDLFASIKEACETHIASSQLFVNDSFVCYLALHFLGSYERHTSRKSASVVYVCSTGLGVTNLITQTIQKRMKGIKIVGFASILNVGTIVQQLQPDFVISIFPLEELDVPWVKVEPILTEQNLKSIQEYADAVIQRTAEDELPKAMTHSSARLLDSDSTVYEQESQEIIIKGYVIYQSIVKTMADKLDEALLDSLMLHVLLAVHRIAFDHQYMDETDCCETHADVREEDVQSIRNIFTEQGLAINQSEMMAMLHYFKRKEGYRGRSYSESRNINE